MPASLEFGSEKNFCHLNRRGFVDDAAAHCDHICVVVPARHLCGVRIVAECRAYALDLVCRNRNADTAATDQNTTIKFTRRDATRESSAVIGLIYRLIAVGAEVGNIQCGKPALERLFEFVTAVVCCDGNFHLVCHHAHAIRSICSGRRMNSAHFGMRMPAPPEVK